MARIRTIKPEFWTSPSTRSLSPMARLLFIGTWNLADDQGRLLWDHDYLRGQLFMSDDLSPHGMQTLMEECVSAHVVEAYIIDGVSYAQVVNFSKHQVINRPSKPKLPAPPAFPQVRDGVAQPSVRVHTQIMDGSHLEQGTGNREQGKDDDKKVSVATGLSSSSKLQQCEQAVQRITDHIIAQAVARGVRILDVNAYRQGVKMNVWSEHGPTIVNMIDQQTPVETIIQIVTQERPEGTKPKPQAIRDAESFVNGLWLTGSSRDMIVEEVLYQYGPGDQRIAALDELNRLVKGETDTTTQRSTCD